MGSHRIVFPYNVETLVKREGRDGTMKTYTGVTVKARSLNDAADIAATFPRITTVHITYVGGNTTEHVCGRKDGIWTSRGGERVTQIGQRTV